MPLNPPSWWYDGRVPWLAYALYPVSVAYGKIVIRRFEAVEPHACGVPVICIGNFTVGGAGKTPLAMKIASLLKEMGAKPGFLTRGYGGTECGPHRVGDYDTSDRVGDEPLVLARLANTVVSRDRIAGARVLESLGADVIVMDDGLQNPYLRKDLTLVALDNGAGLGSGCVFPLGPLRAPIEFQASLAHAVVKIGAKGPQTPPQKSGPPSKLLPSLPFFEAILKPASANPVFAGPWVAFCGIGRPSKFYDTLREAGVNVVEYRSFPDHHRFSEQDCVMLRSLSAKFGARLVTTEKDFVRLHKASPAFQSSVTPFAVELSFEPESEARLKQLLSGLNIKPGRNVPSQNESDALTA